MFNILSSLFGSSNFETLSGQVFKNKYKADKNAVLLDVRTPNEFNSGTLPGAKNVDFTSSSFKSKIVKLDKGKFYYVFCRSGARSSAACKTMSGLGYNVCNLRGGINSWPN